MNLFNPEIIKSLNIQENSCLFLDRDGVINKRLVDEYVTTWKEFEFIEGVFNALQVLQKHYKTIIIVTNQQGIAKGLYTVNDLHKIHNNMLQQFEENNIFIDGVFFAPKHKTENSIMRKPLIGMALQAQKIFENICFQNSVIVGDSISDMQFGRNANIKTVFVGNELEFDDSNKMLIDFRFSSLNDFANIFLKS